MEPLLPDSDPDLVLARRLAAGAPPPESDAPFVGRLDAYRQRVAGHPAPERSEALWAAIDAETRPRARLHALPLWSRWAAVAAVLLAGMAVLVLLRDTPSAPLYYAAAPGGPPQTVTLPDGSRVTLRAGTTLEGLDETRYRVHGEAFFDVAHDPDRLFEVEAGPGLVQVLGTRFDVRTSGLDAEVFLEEGRVRFAAGDSAVVLAPGEVSTLAGGVPTAPTAGVPEAALGWLDGRLVFQQRPLGRLARELEAHYGIRIDVTAAQAAQTLTGTVVLNGPDDTLAQLARVTGGRFEQTDARTYRLVVE